LCEVDSEDLEDVSSVAASVKHVSLNHRCAVYLSICFYVAGHPLLNRRCKRLPGCIHLRNDLCCVGWGVKLCLLTHSVVWTDFTTALVSVHCHQPICQ